MAGEPSGEDGPLGNSSKVSESVTGHLSDVVEHGDAGEPVIEDGAGGLVDLAEGDGFDACPVEAELYAADA